MSLENVPFLFIFVVSNGLIQTPGERFHGMVLLHPDENSLIFPAIILKEKQAEMPSRRMLCWHFHLTDAMKTIKEYL